MAGVDDRGVLIDRCDGAVRRRAVTMPVVMMLDGVAARVARMRTENGNQACENRAQQRQKNDCLDHVTR